MATGDAGSLKWENMFDHNDDGHGVDIPDLDGLDGDTAKPKKGGGSKKRLSVERIYQKKTQLEHILLRPDTYIGSVEKVVQPMWVVNEDGTSMEQRDCAFVPGLYKIFDEIIVNAADNKQRDAKMSTLKIDIDPENCKIKIWNNGKGIPVVMHQTENMYVPSLIFGVLLTSSNYNDDEKKVTGGRNGFGAKLCNVFSTKFVVETQCNEYKKAFRQTWTNNMSKTSEPKITEARGEDYTCVTFHPDLSKFKMESLDKDTVDIFIRRAYDIAAAAKGVKVILNGKRISVSNFKQYCNMYLKKEEDDGERPVKLIHEQVNERWEVGVSLSEKGFQQASFVNSIATTKGGRHVDYITDQVVNKIIEIVKKKEKKGVQIKPFQVKSHLWIFVNCLIENPCFDSQTKENMTSLVKNFGSKCQLGESFMKQITRSGIVEAVQTWMKFKATAMMDKKSGSKTSKLKGIPKLDDANNAGTKHSMDCTLILTEGDSAKTLAVAGLQVVGRDTFGVFPLKGKVLNVREASHKQIMENAEITNLLKIVGLRYKEKYETPESMKTLRYGKIMIMTDQDQDGSHIKGLLINFVHHNWPNLLKHGFLEEFITPIVKVKKANTEKAFYSIPEFEEWKNETDNWHTYKIKYYKGLGTSTSKEAKEYFSDMVRHKVGFNYSGTEDDASILLAFSKKKVDDRKEWLTNWMEERKRRHQLGLPELYLYGKDTKAVTFSEFVNRELILFSNMDNERSIPSVMDGLKPGQRKVMFTCFKRKLVKEIKVAQLAGSVAEVSAYHHGEMSLMGTIVNLAQNFVGSNNINLLQPIGQFGTRLHGGKDAASPRYIFTALSPLARIIFNAKDDVLLRSQLDDNQVIEPEWYCPIIPMVLINGAEGIGTGWSTKIPNYDPREVVRNLKRMLEGREPQPMMPSFKNFKGTIEQVDNSRYVCNGEAGITEGNAIEITELPIRTWTQGYKEGTLEPMLQGTEKTPALIQDYREYHTDVTVKFVVRMAAEKLEKAEEQGIHKVFKLQTPINTSSMVLFDANGCIKKYESVLDILRDFYTVRLDYYQRRKDALEAMLAAESLKLDNIARFICEKIDGIITIENKPKKELIQMLVRRGYDSDPVKAWKDANSKLQRPEEDEEAEEETSGPDYNYLLGMPLWNLTKEKKDELLKQRDDKAEELYQLRKKSKEDLWLDDLDHFLVELDTQEEKEREDEKVEVVKSAKTAKGRQRTKKIQLEETQPSPMSRRIEPKIDPALRAKAAAANKAKERKIMKKEAADMFGALDNEDEDSKMGLAERLAAAQGLKRDDPALQALSPDGKSGSKTKAAGGAKAKPAKPRAPRTASGDKKKTTPKKGGKKRNPWSDSEDDDNSMGSGSGSDVDMDGSFTVQPRDRGTPRRTAAAKKKYNYSDSEEAPDFSESEDEQPAPKTVTNGKSSKSPDVSPANSPPRKMYSSESEDDAGGFFKSTKGVFDSEPSSRPKSPIFSVSDSDDEPVWPPKETAPPAKKEPAKKEPAKKEPAKKAPAAKKTKSTKAPKSDPKQPTLLQFGQGKRKAKATALKFSSDDSDEARLMIDMTEDTVSSVPSQSKAGMSSQSTKASAADKPPKPKKAPVKRKPKTSDASDASDYGDDASKKPASKKPAPKKRAPAKKKKLDSDDEDSWAEAKPKKSSTAAKKKKKEDSDLSDVNLDDVEPRERGAGRARKTVKYTFDDNDSDDDDFY